MENSAEQVTINGITYNVLDSTTVEQHLSAGRVNTARVMVSHKQARNLVLQRPNGRLAFCASQFTSGNYTNPRSLGRW